MTVRLDGLVIRGEIDNTRPYSVCGWLKLRGHRSVLTLNLTGDCDPALQGTRLRFEDAIPLDDHDDLATPDLSHLAWQQIGPTGQIYLDVSEGHPPKLRLEWFGQNGRVTLDLPNPIVESVDEDDEEDETDWPEGMSLDDIFGDGELSSTGFSFDDDGDEDPYGLFSSDLFDWLDEESDRLDVELFGEMGYEPPPEPPNMEIIEGLMEGGGFYIHEVFDPPIRLPHAESLNDAEVEAALKKLLARLAEMGISLDVCPHYSPRDAYELLLEEICPFQTTHPDLNTHHWVQHFSTSDYCEECEAEFEREFEEFERNRHRDDDDDD